MISENKKKLRNAKTRQIIDAIITYLILIIICFIFVFPVLWLVLSSFSATGSIYDYRGFFPIKFGTGTFVKLFTDTTLYNYPKWLLNTLLVSTLSALLGTFLTILTAYTMSRLKFKSRKALMKTTLILGLFPSFMGMVAVYIIMTQLKLVNNLWGLIIIYSAGAPMTFMVQKGFFDTIPYEMDEAATMHGANKFQIFTQITLPVSKPMIVYSLLTSFTWPWSDFLLPKMLLKTKNMYTVAVGLMTLGEDEFSRFAAGSIFIAVPIVLLYFLLSRFMVNGLSAGSVKE